MKKILAFMVSILFFLINVECIAVNDIELSTIVKNQPYSTFYEAPLRTLKPQGWLKTRLEVQVEGMTGNVKSCGGPFAEGSPTQVKEGWTTENITLGQKLLSLFFRTNWLLD